jgi:hypothetical protein
MIINPINKNEINVFIESLIDVYLDKINSMTNRKKTNGSKTRRILSKSDSFRYRLQLLSPEPKVQFLDLEEQQKSVIKGVYFDNSQSFDSASLSNLTINNISVPDKPKNTKISIDCIDIEDSGLYYKCTLFSDFSITNQFLNNGNFRQKYTFNSNSLLLQFYIQCFKNIYFDSQIYDNKVIFQHDTKSISISHRYLLTQQDVLLTLIKDTSVNLIQTDIATIPIHQLTAIWKIIPLFKRQFVSRHLRLVNINSYYTPNNQIYLQIDIHKKSIIFDKNHGMIYIPFLNTQMLTSDFHNVEYNSISNVLTFNLKFMRKICIPVHELDINKIETFVNSCNVYKEINYQNYSLEFKVFENIENSYKDILCVSKMIINKEKECLVMIFHDRIEISKIVKVHNIRTYLNNDYLLKYKFILSARIEDICLETSQYYCNDSLDIVLGLISYIQGNYISVYKNPKVITLTCKSLAEKKIGFVI